MGPKSDKTNKKLKCPFYNTGFCKNGEECSKVHPDKVCEDTNCFNDNCKSRHPNPCKYGNRCKFNWKNKCLYSHVTFPSDDDSYDALEKKLNKKIEALEKLHKEIQCNMEKTMIDKDKQINNLQKDLEIKNTQINALEMRVNEVEKDLVVQKKHHEKRIKDIENSCKQKVKKDTYQLPEHDVSTIQCIKCDYKTTSRQGLKIHNSKVHSNINFEEFPAACDVCEKVLQNESDLRKHKKSQHVYHTVRYQCNECEFMANETETLNVHFGRKHSPKQQCGLCDENFKNSEDLENHLTKCEIYMCSNSGCRDYFKTLEEIKQHISEHHRKNSPAHYSFSYWIVETKDRSEKEIKKHFHNIYPKDW